MVDARTETEDVGPVPSQQPLAVDFIENRLTYRTAQVELPVRFDTRKQKFVDREVQLQTTTVSLNVNNEELLETQLALEKTNENFKRAVKAFLQKKRDKAKKKLTKGPAIVRFDVEAIHDWKGACQALESAISEYENDKTVSGKLRGTFRRISNKADSMKAFVGLLPDGSYKTLCGGLTLILTVGAILP